MAQERSQNNNDTSKRGFGSMDEEKQREIARKGGQASHGGQDSSNRDQNQNRDKE